MNEIADEDFLSVLSTLMEDEDTSLINPLIQVKTEPTGLDMDCSSVHNGGLTDNSDVDDTEFGDILKTAKKRKRSSNNPDSEIISEATTQYLKMLNIDPNSREGKKQRRRIRNRMSAQMHREKKRAYIESLETTIKEKDATILQLNENIRNLIAENSDLRSQLGKIMSSKPLGLPNQNTLLKFEEGTSSEDSEYYSDDNSSKIMMGTASDMSLSPMWKDDESEPPAKTSKSMTLFSIVMLLCFGFFNMGSLDSRFPVSTWFAPDQYHQHQVPTMGSGRLLLSFDSNEKDMDIQSRDSLYSSPVALLTSPDDDRKSSVSSTVNLIPSSSVPSVSNQNALSTNSLMVSATQSSSSVPLWRYQRHVAQVYQQRYTSFHEGQWSAKSDGENGNNLSNNTKKEDIVEPKRNLRVPLNRTKASSSRYSDEHVKLNRDHRQPLIGQTETVNSDFSVALSQILLTHGRVLLNPSLVSVSGNRKRATSSSSPSVVVTPRESDQMKNLRLESKSSNVVVTPWRNSEQATSNGKVYPSESPSNDSDDTVDESNVVQQLVVLLPASSVQWGNEWRDGHSDSDSDENFLSHILRNLKLSNEENGENNNNSNAGLDDKPDLSTFWLEISCIVNKARVIQHVVM